MARMAVCPEAQILRLFVPQCVRDRAVRKLVRRYKDGRRSASDVCQALTAMAAQMHWEHCGRLLLDALDAVHPVPTVLWLWACRHVHVLGCGVVRHMLRLAAARTRFETHLKPYIPKMAESIDGTVALIHEAHRFPDWAPPVLRAAIRAHT